MTTPFGMATPETFAGRGARQREAVKLPPAIASGWADVRSAWTRLLARHRLQRGIAHLDDRLLADIGLGPQHLGFAERFARRQAARAAVWLAEKDGL